MNDFHFNVHMDGKIIFEIHYEEETLPKVLSEARTRVNQVAKTAAKENVIEHEATYNVPVPHKELVITIGSFISAKSKYLRAPTYAFAVGSYNIDKDGTLTSSSSRWQSRSCMRWRISTI